MEFIFPKNKKIKSVWLSKIKRNHFNPDKQHSSKLCSDHLHPSCFSRNPLICQQLKGPIPSILIVHFASYIKSLWYLEMILIL